MADIGSRLFGLAQGQSVFISRDLSYSKPTTRPTPSRKPRPGRRSRNPHRRRPRIAATAGSGCRLSDRPARNIATGTAHLDLKSLSRWRADFQRFLAMGRDESISGIPKLTTHI